MPTPSTWPRVPRASTSTAVKPATKRNQNISNRCQKIRFFTFYPLLYFNQSIAPNILRHDVYAKSPGMIILPCHKKCASISFRCPYPSFHSLSSVPPKPLTSGVVRVQTSTLLRELEASGGVPVGGRGKSEAPGNQGQSSGDDHDL